MENRELGRHRKMGTILQGLTEMMFLGSIEYIQEVADGTADNDAANEKETAIKEDIESWINRQEKTDCFGVAIVSICHEETMTLTTSWFYMEW